MDVIYINDINDIKNDEPICLCLGYFDGVHLGHKELIKECLNVSNNKNYIPSLLTFSPSPSSILNPLNFKGNLNTLEDKLDLINKEGIKKVFVVKFNQQLSLLTKDDFINKILKNLNTKHIVCGFDFTFGYKGEGNSNYLSSFFDISIIEEYKYKNEKVSSSRIKFCLQNGNIEEANYMLGYNYKIKGEVVHGLKNGRLIGFPTANIDHNNYFLPKNGVYACYTYIDGKKYKSMVNVGNHPTISKLDNPIIETNVFDFNEFIYGKTIEIEFISFIRDEFVFDGIENLKKRLNLDTKLIAKIL